MCEACWGGGGGGGAHAGTFVWVKELLYVRFACQLDAAATQAS